MDRYHRQTLLPQIGAAGAARLAAARVLIIGCGALGTTMAESLARAGVGFLRLVDRDIVELTNLQRQVLFDEADAAEGTPKAVAATRRLRAINSTLHYDATIADVNATNIESVVGVLPKSDSPVDLILDGTDNAETRYLINDVAVKHKIPWIYCACLGVQGRVMPVIAGVSPCLRCVFPVPPTPGELPTCDTAGVLGPAVGAIASMAAVEAIRLLVTEQQPVAALLHIDFWSQRYRATPVADDRDPNCPTCGRGEFTFLDSPHAAGGSTQLCGRNAVQVNPVRGSKFLDLRQLAQRLTAAGASVHVTPHLLKCRPADQAEVSLTIFPDGRAIVHGTADPARARTLYARWVGA